MVETYTELLARKLFMSPIGAQVAESVLFYDFSGYIGNYARIDSYSVLTGNVIINDGVHISPFSFLSATGGVIEFKGSSGLGSHSAVLTTSDDYSLPRTSGKSKIKGNISIGENTIIGSNCVILPSTEIGQNCIVGSGVILNGYIKDNTKIVSAASRWIMVNK